MRDSLMNLENQLIRQEKSQTGQAESASVPVASSTRKLLAVILLIAVVLRIVSAIAQGNTVVALPGIYDQISYDGLARRVVDGYGFSFAEDHWPMTRAGEPTAHWSYLYTLYLAAIYSLFGAQPVIARLVQAILAGILHSWLTWRIGRRVFGPTAGLVAAGLSAVYIYFFYYAGGLLTETFYITGILWTMDTTLRLRATAGQASTGRISPASRRRLWLELGLAIGVTVLLRQLFLLIVPFLFLWLWWTLSPLKSVPLNRSGLLRRVNWSTLGGLLGATFIVVILIVPWTIRNYRAFGTFVPLNTNAGFAFFWGNHPIHGVNFIPILPDDGPFYTDLIPEELRSLNEADLDRALLKRSIEFISQDPLRYLLLSLSRTREYFKFWPAPDSSAFSNLSRVASFGILLPFMLYGVWLSTYRLRNPAHWEQRSQIILLYLFIVLYTGIHLLTWTLIRYRLPVDAVLLIFAAYGIENIARRICLPGGSLVRIQPFTQKE